MPEAVQPQDDTKKKKKKSIRDVRKILVGNNDAKKRYMDEILDIDPKKP